MDSSSASMATSASSLVTIERRRDADGARPAAQEENAPLEGQFDDAVALGRAIFLRLLVFDDFDADHQAAAANVAHDFVLLRPVRHALHHVIADFGGVLHQLLAFDHVEGGQRGRDADRIAAEGGGVRAGDPVHDFGACSW